MTPNPECPTPLSLNPSTGKTHSTDSKDIAFQSAGKLAVKAALDKGGTKLMQPMDAISFRVPESLQGDLNAIVSRFRGWGLGFKSMPSSHTHIRAHMHIQNLHARRHARAHTHTRT